MPVPITTTLLGNWLLQLKMSSTLRFWFMNFHSKLGIKWASWTYGFWTHVHELQRSLTKLQAKQFWLLWWKSDFAFQQYSCGLEFPKHRWEFICQTAKYHKSSFSLQFNASCVLSCFSCVWLCVTLWTTDLPGSSVHEILQARIREWIAIPSSRGSSWPRDRTCISYVSCIGRWVLYH